MALFNFFFFFPEKQTTSGTQKSVQCGTWTKHAEGGVFTSPNYPSKYPPDRECIYIIEGEGLGPHLATSVLGTDCTHVDATKIGFAHTYLSGNQITVLSGIKPIIGIIRVMNR